MIMVRWLDVFLPSGARPFDLMRSTSLAVLNKSNVHGLHAHRLLAIGHAANRFTGGENGGAVFVADDLGAWLAGLLADPGYKKLTTTVPGSDQERVLRSAGIAAVRLTAESHAQAMMSRPRTWWN